MENKIRRKVFLNSVKVNENMSDNEDNWEACNYAGKKVREDLVV